MGEEEREGKKVEGRGTRKRGRGRRLRRKGGKSEVNRETRKREERAL